jgi:hypothetical protein
MASMNPSNDKKNEFRENDVSRPADEKSASNEPGKDFRLPPREKRREIIKKIMDEKRAKQERNTDDSSSTE